MVRSASVEVGEAVQGETKVRRAFCCPDKLVEGPAADIHTMADVFSHSLKRFPNRPVMGWRDVVKIHQEEKEVTKMKDGKEVKEMKKWEFYELSNYKYLTYTELNDRVQDASSGLRGLGLSNNTRFNIYASTGVNWQNMAHACFRQSIPFCTAYDTLGEEGLQHSLSEPEVVGIFTNGDLMPTLTNVIDKTPTVKYVIYDGEPKADVLEKLKEKLQGREGSAVLTLDELRKRGKENPAEANPAKADDVACIMYTSGSTGAPKGVILTHSNLVAAIGGVEILLGEHLKPEDTYIAYLPLAHILEFIVECAMIYVGVTMGYAKVKTLTQASVRNCDGDIKAFKPSIMVGVPAVWELIRKGIVAKVNASSVKKSVFNGAMTIKRNKVPVLSGVMDSVVFKAVKDQTGGRLRLALSGGAPLSKETQEFLDIALVQLLQGYGMTETCGMCAILTPEYMQYSTVGVPVPAIEVKLKDVPDAGYFATNKPFPQGEILIRGPAVTKGYFKRDDVNKETFTSDGWLMTGDVGQWNKDGTLSIIDRKKNLVKLSGGEYIAIERLESTYKSCDLVANICVHADSDAKQPMAIIFPKEEALGAAAQKAGLKKGELEDMCRDKQINDLVLREINAVGKKAGFKSLEQLQCVVLVHEELNMTAAQKLERKKIVEKYQDDIKKNYP